MGQPVVHFEIGGRDLKQLKTFYSSQFGWKIDSNNPMQYGMVDTGRAKDGPGIPGGVFALPADNAPTSLTIYIGVPNIDKALKKIEKAGGKIVMPKLIIPNMVTFAQFSDPAGNIVGLVEDSMPVAVATSASSSKAASAKKAVKKAPTVRAQAKAPSALKPKSKVTATKSRTKATVTPKIKLTVMPKTKPKTASVALIASKKKAPAKARRRAS